MNPIKPTYVAVSPDELQALNQIVQDLNYRFAALGANLNGKTTLDRLFELADKGLKVEQMFKTEPVPLQDTIQVPERTFEHCIYLIHFTDEESRIKNIRELMAKLDAEGWSSDEPWNERLITEPSVVFLKCNLLGDYNLFSHDCNFRKSGFPLYHWCGADPTKHRPRVKVGDRVVATTNVSYNGDFYQKGFIWPVCQTDTHGEPVVPNGFGISFSEGYRLATKYDV